MKFDSQRIALSLNFYDKFINYIVIILYTLWNLLIISYQRISEINNMKN